MGGHLKPKSEGCVQKVVANTGNETNTNVSQSRRRLRYHKNRPRLCEANETTVQQTIVTRVEP